MRRVEGSVPCARRLIGGGSEGTEVRVASALNDKDARGEIRTRTGISPRWILSPLRLPFRHSGAGVRYTTRRLGGHPTPV